MRVIFVDDDPQVLKGIIRMLDCAEVEWDVATANNGDDALELLREAPTDVIVADMKMSGMDGAQLLSEVSRLSPSTVRIVLSGHADKNSVYRAVAPMHQFLSKPCEAEKLQQIIARSCSLRQFLETTGSHEILGKIDVLPSLPDLYQNVVAEIESENGTLANVGELVSQDLAMTAKILQLANSSIFGLPTKVTSPSQAAMLIGMDVLKSLVLSLSVFKSFDEPEIDGFDISTMTEHCFHVGSLGRHIATTEGLNKETVSEVFTSGLLHDVGKLILATHASDGFAQAIAKSKSDNISMVEAEQAVFGLGHHGIGSYLLSLWGLPQSVIEGVFFHHSPEHCLSDELDTAAIVYIANHLAKSHHGEAQIAEFDNFVEEMGIADRIDAWTQPLAEEVAIEGERK